MQNLIASLLEEQTSVVRDALWGDIRLSSDLSAVYRCKAVQKLSRIKQLGPVSIVYPSAVHTRLDHSLGVYHIAFSIMLSLLRKGSSLFTLDGIHSFLCAALLHDIGHFPYAHSLKELALEDHEHLAALMILDPGELHDTLASHGFDCARVSAIIDSSLPSGDEEILCYRTLLSGTLDPDKLDYLNRDAFFCGVPYGAQDASYITSHLTMVEGNVALEEQALASVEHILFAKYLMYRNVYWHKGTRSGTAMIKETLLTLLLNGKLQSKQLYGLDDESFHEMLSALDDDVVALAESVWNGVLLPCVYEVDYDATNPLQKQASTLSGRMEAERQIEASLQLPPHSIIIDIPEPVSFESSMPIVLENGSLSSFAQEDQLFHSDIASVFTRCLRKFRIFSSATPDLVKKALVEKV